MERRSDSELKVKLGMLYPKPYEPELDRDTTAVLCVDLQYQYLHPDFGTGARAKDRGITDFLSDYWPRVHDFVIPNAATLQQAARAAGIEVIHVRIASITADGRDSSRRYRRLGNASPADSKSAQIVPAVAPVGDELTFIKVTSSPFNSTNIDRILRNMGISNLVVVGVLTNGCVESTVRSAAELDYGVYVVEDATAAIAPQLHEHSILSMGYKDAAVTSTADIVRMLRRIGPGGPGQRLGRQSS